MPWLNYQRARFATQLPVEHLYTASHSWVSRLSEAGNCWRVGYTKFALRMLGEIVDVQITRQAPDPMAPGDILGTIEGFKAVSDIYSEGNGAFVRINPQLADGLEVIQRSPYRDGWLYEFEGAPGPRTLDVHGYSGLLDETIDRILSKEQESETSRE